MAATIHDVAKLAGVHASTVSRVLNQKASITVETKERVWAAMKQLDYHPNAMARCLAGGLTGAIGFVLDAEDEPAFHNAFFSSSQFAIEKIAQAHHCHVIIINGGASAGETVKSLILERRVDGLILPPSAANLSLLAMLKRFPYVLLGQPGSLEFETNWVDIDNRLGAKMAVSFLLQKGYSGIAYLGGEQKGAHQVGFIQRRVQGYTGALPQGARTWVLHTDGSPDDACRVALKALQGANRPQAFLCNDNLTAFGLLRAVREAGLSVPRDLGIVTFNNYPLAEYTDPPLTAVHIDTTLLGEETARLLFRRIKRGDDKAECEHILLPPALIERVSSNRC